MRRGYFKLRHELLVQALHLPSDAKIIAVDFHSPRTCKVWVEHRDIPEVEETEAMEYPELMPTFHRDSDMEFLVDWGA